MVVFCESNNHLNYSKYFKMVLETLIGLRNMYIL